MYRLAVSLAAVGGSLCAMLFFGVPAGRRGAFLLHLALAALLAAALAWPFILDDLAAVRARHGGAGLAFSPYAVLGTAFPAGARRYFDVPAFWAVLLPFGLPAIVPLAALAPALGNSNLRERHRFARVFGVTACACLGVAWLFASTIDNNDLGWRAVLPAILLLAALGGASLVRLTADGRRLAVAVVVGIGCLGVPDAARMLREYFGGQLPGSPAAFYRAQDLWRAVRRYTGTGDRVANNVLAVAEATPWPVNIGWAVLGDRPSCYAGWESVLAYGAMPKARLIETNDVFTRVFGGNARPSDVALLARDYDCATVAISRDDGAWMHDPFAASDVYNLAEQGERWRIYTRIKK